MNRTIIAVITCALLLALLPACDVLEALEITPMPTQSPAPMPSPSLQEPAYTDGETITFASKLVEEYIRILLGKPEGDITVGDMKTITVFNYDRNYDSRASGTITTLDDMRWCVNLEILTVMKQPIASIEPLRNLSRLRELDISNSNVSDLSPLAGKESLQIVYVDCSPVTDASCVLALTNLRIFYGSGTGIHDISALASTKSLKVFVCENKLDDYTPLLGHTGLIDVVLSGVTDEFHAQLLERCKALQSIRVQLKDKKCTRCR